MGYDVEVGIVYGIVVKGFAATLGKLFGVGNLWNIAETEFGGDYDELIDQLMPRLAKHFGLSAIGLEAFCEMEACPGRENMVIGVKYCDLVDTKAGEGVKVLTPLRFEQFKVPKEGPLLDQWAQALGTDKPQFVLRVDV